MRAILLLGLITIASFSHAQGFDACLSYYAEGNDGWCKVSDDVFNNVRLSDDEASSLDVRGSIGSRAVMTAWNGGALDPDNLIMYFHGGGHNDYYGNEWYAYDIRAGLFERLNDPSPLTHHYYNAGLNRYCRVPDPELSPNSAHTYDGVQFNPETRTIFIVNPGNSAYCVAEPSGIMLDGIQKNIYEFNPSKSETRNGIAPLTYRKHGSHAFTYPRTALFGGNLFLGSNTRVHKYEVSGDQITDLGEIYRNPPSGQGYLSAMNTEVVSYMTAGYLRTFDETGSELHLSVKIPNSGGMDCGPNECLFWSGGQNVSLWDRDQPDSYVEIQHTNGPTNGNERVYSKIQYIPAYGVYVGVSDIAQPVWLYRVAGSEIPTPIPDPVPDPDPAPDPAPDPDYSDWMANPDWSTFTVHPPSIFNPETTYTVEAGGVMFFIEIDKDLENNVYVFRSVGRANIKQLTETESAAIQSVFGGH